MSYKCFVQTQKLNYNASCKTIFFSHNEMNMCQNFIHILLDGQNIINLLIMIDIEIMFKCHVSPYNWLSQMNTCHHGQPL
jgi:hypothetical protein